VSPAVRRRRREPRELAAPTETLAVLEGPRGREYYTRALAEPPAVRGERIRDREGVNFRHWDPTRSKFGAALVLGWAGRRPKVGERWLYLGAGAGTTASHLADLVGRGGAVFAVEPSVRPFLRLLEVADRYPNLLPILGDARHPASYAGSVRSASGLYADVAQPDQVEIVARNAELLLQDGGAVLLVLKTASLGRDPDADRLLRRALAELPPELEVGAVRSLEPFHRRHFLVEARRVGTPAATARRPTTPRGLRLGRSRR
jgi:fibrillarin-like pre-rRNA processing protein